MTDKGETGSAPAGPGLSGGYKAYALLILVVIYTSNFIDRQIIGTVGQAIKKDLLLTDGQLGLLSGIAFAALYSTLGVPIARLAERFNRVTIITVSLALWSGFTAACGLATNFLTLFLARVGVGIGEAGCSPAAQSLISDYYPPQKRATALAIYSLGIPLGSLFGAVLGGQIAQEFGWRWAFMIVGLPGILVAVIARITLKEPVRGTYDPPSLTGEKAPPLGQVFNALFSKGSWRHIAFGASLASFAGYGIAFFAVPLLLRGNYGLDLATAGTAYGVVGGLAAAVGVLLGGFVTDLIGKGSRSAYAIVPGLGFLLCSPLYVWAFLQPTLTGIAIFIIVPLILQYLYLGPTFAVTHNLVEPRMRASATALLFLPINLIGLGLGPPFVGWLSDTLAQVSFGKLGQFDFAKSCPGGFAPPGAAADLAAACHTASYDGVKWAIIFTAGVVYAWAGIHYLLASRTLKREMLA